MQKRIGVENTSVNVRFCGEINNRPGFLFFKNSPNENLITNIAPDELDTIFWQVRDVFQIPRVCKLIQIDYVPVGLGAEQPYEIAADKSTAARHENGSHNISEEHGA